MWCVVCVPFHSDTRLNMEMLILEEDLIARYH